MSMPLATKAPAAAAAATVVLPMAAATKATAVRLVETTSGAGGGGFGGGPPPPIPVFGGSPMSQSSLWERDPYHLTILRRNEAPGVTGAPRVTLVCRRG